MYSNMHNRSNWSGGRTGKGARKKQKPEFSLVLSDDNDSLFLWSQGSVVQQSIVSSS